MHFRLPKPLHGWREFAGEVGIIVVGVLIALGAEQVVEAAHWRESVAEAKQSLGDELTGARMSSAELIVGQVCMKRKLDRLETIVEGRAVPADTQVRLFGLREWGTSTWEAASSSGAVAHMSPDDRNGYATIFGLVRVLGGLATKAYESSSDLSTLDRHTKLTDVSRDRLEADLARLRNLNFMLGLGARQLLDGTAALHLHIGPDGQAGLARERAYMQRCPMPDAPPSER